MTTLTRYLALPYGQQAPYNPILLWQPKAPNSTLDYVFDMGGWLTDDGSTIDHIVIPPPTGINAVWRQNDTSSGLIVVRISGGSLTVENGVTSGTRYGIEIQAVLTSGEVQSSTIYIDVVPFGLPNGSTSPYISGIQGRGIVPGGISYNQTSGVLSFSMNDGTVEYVSLGIPANSQSYAPGGGIMPTPGGVPFPVPGV